jgi:shikimate dehydrogenase
MTWFLGIIGYPLGHSISPIFQQAALDHYGLDARYEVWETEPSKLPALIRRLRSPDVLGANVTVPHKEEVLKLLDEVSRWGREVGAVNTIVNRERRLIGHNTDSYGFLRALREDASFDPRGKDVLILGAGGAAKAVALGLAREGVARIAIANRTPKRAEELAAALRRYKVGVEVLPLDGPDLARAAGRSHLIVHCTTLGMRHSPTEGQTPLKADAIPRGALVYDLVYNPLETPLLLEARKAGARTVGGLPMLVYQGVASFELWTGRKAPVEVMFRAARKALSP